MLAMPTIRRGKRDIDSIFSSILSMMNTTMIELNATIICANLYSFNLNLLDLPINILQELQATYKDKQLRTLGNISSF